MLKHHPQVPAYSPDILRRHYLAIKHNLTRSRLLHPINAPQECGLTRPRRPEHYHPLPLFQLKINPFQHLILAKRFPQAPYHQIRLSVFHLILRPQITLTQTLLNSFHDKRNQVNRREVEQCRHKHRHDITRHILTRADILRRHV